ncbi:MAG: hypothetical protein K2O03_03720 [Lachnospiraceae bacterium]|nr:hypothetical protein [Lachnospiraceae bacterium]
MKNSKKIIIVSLVFVLVAAIFAYGKWQGGAGEEDDVEVNRYAYPTDFSDCLFPEQKKAKGKVPEEILSEMNVEELVWAVIDYPFLFEAGLSSYRDPESKSWADCEWIAKGSNAFKKLTECKKPEDKIIKVLKTAEEESSNEEEKDDAYFARWVFYDAHGKYFSFNKKQLDFLSAPYQ